MTYTVLHNPSCSTSRNGLVLLDEKGISYDVRKYMNVSEALSVDELRDIAKKLGADSPRAFLRDKDAKKFELPDTASDDEVYAAMAENPRLIQRPIGINGDKAALGRPIENLLDIV
ncbi:arsenate reductase family protein [Ponticaulis sp.]|uniref:arsenate reductase family protein n=1 Tax=Ponticaulis sp. TaxID=2020902 RepID=UPI000B6FD0A2|nr:arsenate reductase family protein [Ponticaulis sp.]MAI90272.1 arsenate reductase [Ponticaulis sp.]OUX99914.1 MAG: arsenate reductase [Hyphomonadaceae bacterium TMED5]|tara:strand:- start:252515 stop:252862 length:348 start_codon:yes stop_codon:yes gene_type:complete